MFLDVKLFLHKPIVPKMLCGILALLCILQISTAIVSFFTIDKLMNTSQKQFNAANASAKQDLSNAGLTMAFFGDFIPKNLNDAGVKKSMLNLKVVGILFSDNQEGSQVIIRTADGQEQSFKVGDSVPGGAIIKRITNDGVFVLHGGELESLSLPKNQLIFEAPARPLNLSNGKE